MPNSVAIHQVTSKMILDHTIVDSDVNPAAGIGSGKLNLSAIDQDLVSAGDATRNLGKADKRWVAAYLYQLYLSFLKSDIIPGTTNTYNLGTELKKFYTGYINYAYLDKLGKDLDLRGYHKIRQSIDPTDPQDLTTKAWVEANFVAI